MKVEDEPMPEKPEDAPPEPNKDDADGKQASHADRSLITVSVPAKAKIFVNGKATLTPGELRVFAANHLTPGASYTYRIRAELERDGRTLTQVKVVQIHAGEGRQIQFDFTSNVATTATR